MLVERRRVAAVASRDRRARRRGRAARPGEMVGELALLDGGRTRWASARPRTRPCLCWAGRDFMALLTRHVPSAFALKRRLAAVFIARHRSQLAHLAASLGLATRRRLPPGARARSAPLLRAARQQVHAPHGDVPRLRLARAVGLPDLGELRAVPPGRTLLAEGALSEACYLTINGAVEKVLLRGDRRIRVGLAGPGKAFGYESLIDGLPSPVTAITRERSLAAGAAQRAVRRSFQRRERHLARVPGRGAARPGGDAARDVATTCAARRQPVALRSCARPPPSGARRSRGRTARRALRTLPEPGAEWASPRPGGPLRAGSVRAPGARRRAR